MKTKILKHRVPQRILIGMLLVLFCFTSKAQTWENVHFNVDWQMNVPLNSNFADKFSGWGMNFEGKYDLTPYWAIGAFLISYQSPICGPPDHPPHPNGFIDNRPATISVPTTLRNICILQVTG